MPSSGRPGAPILRATNTSKPTPDAAATWAATGTPPRGSANTTGSARPSAATRSPSCRPPSYRSRNRTRPPVCRPAKCPPQRIGQKRRMSPMDVPSATDAVIIGAGPNGLVAANLLADAGWDVVVLEEQPEPGGAVRSAPGPAPGFVSDTCSAFYPLAAASPAMRALELERHGLTWRHAPNVLAHPLPDGRCAVLHRDLEQTVDGLEKLGVGDGDAWRRLYGLWERIGDQLIQALFTPFPPMQAAGRLAARLGPSGLLRFARQSLLPVRRLAKEEFTGDGAGLLLAGSALHADLMPESAGSGTFGWLLGMVGQQCGFPVPVGGAGELTAALVRRLESRGGRLVCNAAVRTVVVRGNRAVAVRTGDGNEVTARRAVLADVVAPQLYGGLVDWAHLPTRLRDDIRRFEWDFATFKVDFALSGPVPWSAPDTSGAGTVHLAADLDELSTYSVQLAAGNVPDRPFLLVGQMTTTDPTRSPAGTESLWAYTHLPQVTHGDAGPDGLTGSWDHDERERMADRIQARIEKYAPDFASAVIARRVLGPREMQARDENLIQG